VTSRTPIVARRKQPCSKRQLAGMVLLTAAPVFLIGFSAFASQHSQSLLGWNWPGLAAVLVVATLALVARRRH
jgi:hypothetical protein